ncbi:MAG: hypothetical protein MMC33_006194 [Icmadophila ericetorum]|nr:hypothetical protein [Icmadophila ericetorum]
MSPIRTPPTTPQTLRTSTSTSSIRSSPIRPTERVKDPLYYHPCALPSSPISGDTGETAPTTPDSLEKVIAAAAATAAAGQSNGTISPAASFKNFAGRSLNEEEMDIWMQISREDYKHPSDAKEVSGKYKYPVPKEEMSREEFELRRAAVRAKGKPFRRPVEKLVKQPTKVKKPVQMKVKMGGKVGGKLTGKISGNDTGAGVKKYFGASKATTTTVAATTTAMFKTGNSKEDTKLAKIIHRHLNDGEEKDDDDDADARPKKTFTLLPSTLQLQKLRASPPPEAAPAASLATITSSTTTTATTNLNAPKPKRCIFFDTFLELTGEANCPEGNQCLDLHLVPVWVGEGKGKDKEVKEVGYVFDCVFMGDCEQGRCVCGLGGKGGVVGENLKGEMVVGDEGYVSSSS